MQERFVDIAIIGAGTSGLNAMSQARKAGKSFVLINGGEPGTTCARVGCMPSKAMIQVAEDYHRRTHLGRYGIDGHEGLQLNLAEALEHVQDIRDTFVDRVLGSSTDDLPEDLFLQDYARFLEPTLLAVGEQRIRAGAVVIATGSRPRVPEPWRAFGDKLLTTDSLFELADLPASIAVIGLGTIGLELGQSLHRLGIQVEGFDQLATLAGIRDPEVNQAAIQVIGKEFPLHLGQPVQISEDGEQLRIRAGAHQISVDALLCSIGRVPNLEGLGLEQLGLELDARGLPPFDRHSMQVGELPVFIAGDVTAERPVLHEAGDEGRIAGYNAVQTTSGKRPARFRRRTPLFINFCDPNICIIGQGFDRLDRDQTAIGEIKMAPVGRALIMGNNRGLIRVYADKTSGRLLGAELMAPRGENLAHLISWSIQQQMTVEQMLRMPFYHPVIEEALQAALNDLNRKLEVKCDGPLTELALLEPSDGTAASR
ncbi:MAG: dihydrolipoyl dehydrogenase [Lamprobacter sp.]|uniref:dihydrolipoyl dehydrogenase n=1 Tax=Lamprobacter sp. TaxID=3100796 RepID=UPI002B256D94|nr:dihydrolipoyl dehydrogenase [Lamprobacter sp.]MEA3639125.1 dihydrolipoyl dehydrogenase [Lamprobacter sp.]